METPKKTLKKMPKTTGTATTTSALPRRNRMKTRSPLPRRHALRNQSPLPRPHPQREAEVARRKTLHLLLLLLLKMVTPLRRGVGVVLGSPLPLMAPQTRSLLLTPRRGAEVVLRRWTVPRSRTFPRRRTVPRGVEAVRRSRSQPKVPTTTMPLRLLVQTRAEAGRRTRLLRPRRRMRSELPCTLTH